MWHVIANTPVDFERFERESDADRMPHHLLAIVADGLGATLHTPDPDRVTWLDRLLAKLYGQPYHWQLARQVLPSLAPGDGVFTTGCDSGVPLALLCIARRRRVAFAISFAEPTRPRTKLAGWIVATLLDRLLVLVTLDAQADAARSSFGKRARAVATIGYTTDCRFFRPGDGPRGRSASRRPLVAGSGTEQRDYRTLAEAIEPMDIDCSVSFVSPNLSARTTFTFPDPVPPNMELRHYEFEELRTLYQTASVMVVPTLPNRASAGLTALFEAIACGCPVIVTDTPGIIRDLIDDDLVIGVEPQSVDDLNRAIKGVLTEPDDAAERAERARRHLIATHGPDQFLRRLTILLGDLVGAGR